MSGRPAERPLTGVEYVSAPRLTNLPAVRLWHDGALEAATCRVDGALHPAEELVRKRTSPGGRALLCRVHARQIEAARYAANRPTPTPKEPSP